MEETKQQDLDLLYFLRKIKQSIKSFFSGISWVLRFSIDNIGRLFIFICIAVAISLSLYFLKKAYYTSYLTVSHTRVDNDYCRELISNLNTYIDGKENSTLANELQIAPKFSKEVRSIKYRALNENVAKRFADSVSVLLPFKVEVQVYDRDVLDTLQRGIMSYLESNLFASSRKTIDLIDLERSEQHVTREMVEIDSLKRIVNESILPRGTGNGIIYGEPLDPVIIYRRAMDLFERKIQINKRQTLINSFEVIVEFNKSAKRADTGIVTYMLIAILLGYIIGLFWLLPRQPQS
jgi:hypothetical protein